MIHRAAATAFALLAVVPAFGQPRTGATERGVISGYFTDAAGCPIPDATLQLRPISSRPWNGPVLQETRSDDQGRFVFAPMNAGTYWVQFENSSDGGAGGGEPVTLTAAGAAVTFQLRAPPNFAEFDLRVLVTDLDETPIRDALVGWHRLVGREESKCAAGALFTAADGWIKQTGVSPGLYRIRVEADGFAPASRDEQVGWGRGPYAIRLRTWAEEEKARKPTRVSICCGPPPPSSIPDLVTYSDAIIVGRIARSALDPAYRSRSGPDVRTRYEIEPVEVIKPHPRLSKDGTSVAVLHWAGEMEWQGTILLGCEQATMKEKSVYVLFLKWDAAREGFSPAHGNELVADVTTGVVSPMRRITDVAPVIAERKGMAAETFLNELRSAAAKRP